MIGYKAFNKDLTCRGFQFEIGKTFSMDESPIPCKRGFHFCKSIAECYEYYERSDNTRICKVEALGEVQTDNERKYCTNSIKIIEEITEDWERKGNSNSSNSGYGNSGYRNSGDRNSGDWNSGDSNSGYGNSGDRNSGYRNSGYGNSGKWNSGDWNSGYRNSGLFNTEKNPKIKMFDKESYWTIDDWYSSDARNIMNTCPCTYSDFIGEQDMTEEEKETHPEYKTIGGFIKTFVATEEDKEKWWNELDEYKKDIIRDLPNFDFDKFRQCVGFLSKGVTENDSSSINFKTTKNATRFNCYSIQ